MEILSEVLLRVFLPIVLLACSVVRPCALSFVYFIFYLYLPFVGSVNNVSVSRGSSSAAANSTATNNNSLGAHLRRYLKLLLTLTFLIVLGQFVFQIVLLSYGDHFIGDYLCSSQVLQIWLPLGFIRLTHLLPLDVIRYVLPDISVLSATIVVYILLRKLQTPSTTSTKTSSSAKQTRKLSNLYYHAGPYLNLGFLCLTSSLEPSIVSSVYYALFLVGSTAWACNFKAKCITVFIFLVSLVVTLIHVVGLYLFQIQVLRDLLLGLIQPPLMFWVRLSGLVEFATYCKSEYDPRVMSVNTELSLSSWLSPLFLAVMYHLVAYQVKILLTTKPRPKESPAKKPMRSSFRRGSFAATAAAVAVMRRTTTLKRKRSSSHNTRRKSLTFRICEDKNSERIPLVSPTAEETYGTLSPHVHTPTSPVGAFGDTASTSGAAGGGGGGGAGVGGVRRRISSTTTAATQQHHNQDTPSITSTTANITSLAFSCLFNTFDLFIKSSYIGTNIIMMAWSITYHSWLTFILLIWACLLWMFPNQRKAMLRSSPVLVLYAECLLIVQYIYSLEYPFPEEVDGINLKEIGLKRLKVDLDETVGPIVFKSLYTLMFWITLRQYITQKSRTRSVIEDAAHESFRITIGTNAPEDLPHSSLQGATSTDTGGRKRGSIGDKIKQILIKVWIWVVAVMLFVIGLGGGDKVVLYRIVYMALFLIFILTFQLSYSCWRKIMYPFWLTVIIYSMLVLVLIYTYQFKDIPQYLSSFIPEQLQKDIGLEKFDTGDLFVRLLTPTFFLVITVIQLHYFHQDFLKISEIRRNSAYVTAASGSGSSRPPSATAVTSPPNDPVVVVQQDEETSRKKLTEDMSLKNIIKNINYYGKLGYKHGVLVYEVGSQILWRVLEIHIIKIVILTMFFLTVLDKSLLHLVLCILIVIAVVLYKESLQTVLIHLCSIYISILFLLKMIYQIDYISHANWDNNCTAKNTNNTSAEDEKMNEFLFSSNPTTEPSSSSSNNLNDAEWLGLWKISNDSSLADLLRGYIGMIVILTLRAVIKIRQRMYNTETDSITIFADIRRPDADKGMLQMIQFFANFAFYKFGVETTLVTLVLVIGTRLDLFSVLYSLWLIPMFRMKRNELEHKVWLPFIIFIAILLPLQYLSSVGLPPFLCIEYPWTSLDSELKAWLFLPDLRIPPDISRLIPDFLLLLVSCGQLKVFRHAAVFEKDAGSNEEILEDSCTSNANPTPDFLSSANVDRSNKSLVYLNLLKKCLFLSFYWITLAIIFLTGTNRVNFFALGYLVGSFIFLWEGNEFYLREKKSIIKRWNYLLAYNVFVIFIKALLQLIGCVFLAALQLRFCWFIQLLGIACLNKFKRTSSEDINRGLTSSDPGACEVPHDEAGLVWDGITFAFLILQRRIFYSNYFFHIRAETEVQAALASRGAELIEELMQKQIRFQEEEEKDVLEKIKMKMDRIKATHNKKQDGAQKATTDNHFDAIRSGDYYMFDDATMADEEEIGMIDSITEEDDSDEAHRKGAGGHRPSGVTLSELMSSALKTGDLDQATELARRSRKKRGRYKSASSSRELSRQTSRKSFRQRSWTLEEAPMETGEGELSDEPSSASEDEDEGEKKPPPPNLLRKILGYIRFAWALVESVMVSLTTWMNKFSKDYRHVSKILATEKSVLKEADMMQGQQQQPGTSQQIALPHDKPSISPSVTTSPSSSKVGSKDDLQTVIEKQSYQDLISVSSEEEVEEHPLINLIVSIWYVIISHSDLVCYFIVFLNQIKSSSILSLPLPLMVLLWGSLSVPRPTKTFWVTIIAYTEAMVILKYLFQFDFFPWNGKSSQVKKDPFWPPRILGIEKQEKYAVYDVILLMAVFFHRFMLKSLGLWKNTGSGSSSTNTSISAEDNKTSRSISKQQPVALQQASTSKSNQTIATVATTSSTSANNNKPSKSSDDLLSEDQIDESVEDSSKKKDPFNCINLTWDQWKVDTSGDFRYGVEFIRLCMAKYLSSIRQFFKQILNLEYKVKVDVYSYMFMCDFFNFLVVIFGFASFGSQDGDVSRYLEENKVPVPFLVMVIVQFALIVIDRALYLRKDIMGKFFFQIALATFVHIAMFFVLPYVTEREFNADGNRPPQMWYMVKCIYLLLSAYQIRSGYPTRILGNFLCKKYNYLNMFLFKGFMAVPFLFELRALMDWIWTDTSMTLSDWLKLEDIFAHIFQLKCQRRVEKEYPQGRGLPKQRWTKYTIGGGSLFLIIAIIWFPLVLFALGNTVGIPNKPLDITVEITLGSYQPIYTMSAQKNSLVKFSPVEWNSLEYIYRRDKSGQNFLSNYEAEDVWVAKLNGNSSSVWGISPPSKDKLMDELLSGESVGVRMTWTITRDATNPNDKTLALGKGDEIELTKENRDILVQMINGTTNSSAIKNGITILGIFPKFVKVSNNGKADVAYQLNQALLDDRHWRYNKLQPVSALTASSGDDNRGSTPTQNAVMRNLTLKLEQRQGATSDSQEWWVVQEDCNEVEKNNPLPLSKRCDLLSLYTFNEKAFPPTLSIISGGGIIGLYTTLVLVASKFVRSFFSGISFLIMFDDMPNVDRIFQLCLDIYLVRESGELALEEDLFAKLIFLYRSPETLIKWTRPKKEKNVEIEQQQIKKQV